MLNSRRLSQGFAVIELLVAIAVVGILIALLLPAVQQAREAARKTQCRSNLKQLSLGLHQYQDALRVFPPGGVVARKQQNIPVCESSTGFGAVDVWAEAQSGPGAQGTSWMVHVLPYIDQAPRHSQWDFAKDVAGNRKVAEADIPIYYCSSRRTNVRSQDQSIMFRGWNAGGNDYGGCVGACNGWHDCGAHESWVVSTDRRPEGPCKGMFRVNSKTRLKDIRDGTSHTLLLGELQRLNGGTDLTSSRDGWAIGAVSTMFSSCSNACHGPNSPHFEELGSAHVGGAHVSRVDGSVNFIANDIDLKILEALGTIAAAEILEL